MKYISYFHWNYYIHRIFPKIKGVYLNGSFKIERERKRCIKIGWANIKEGLVMVLSRGVYHADWSLDEAFKDYTNET